jgi:hypothetical protein
LDSHKAGYKAGVRSTFKLYSLVVLALLLGAVYEVVEAVYFMPLLLSR